MEISKRVACAVAAMMAATIMLTDNAYARDLRGTGPMLGPSPALLNSVSAATTQPAVSKTAVAVSPTVPRLTSSGPPPKGPIVLPVRDHGPGGNDDACLKYKCDQGSELRSMIAEFQKSP